MVTDKVINKHLYHSFIIVLQYQHILEKNQINVNKSYV